ncbi:uncharacterized protein LOC115337543 isoform X4 [Aquila chrysaetos chrysaetos]|uniref:uncharacterized protein LOC115337543 isoform X4 n=1 Tax=Aquila chrysaetos chrysaetos TaxID=223781 RepID=UPI001176B794|nr:uncharacterized protein LOC115337543 isoform X4 [Aquila chrysaetos chrysaetos]
MSKVGEGVPQALSASPNATHPGFQTRRLSAVHLLQGSRALVQPRDVTDGAGCRAGDRGGARCWPSENRAAAELEKLTRNDLGAAFWRGDRAVTGSPAAASARRT